MPKAAERMIQGKASKGSKGPVAAANHHKATHCIQAMHARNKGVRLEGAICDVGGCDV